MFDLGPQYKTQRAPPGVIDIVCDLESNYELPFHADSSMQLVGIRINGEYNGRLWCPYPSRVLLIRSQVLSGFTSRIGTTSTIRWEDWLHIVKPVRNRSLYGAKTHLLHSHFIFLRTSTTSAPPRLRVIDLSLECKRKDGDSDVIAEYYEQEVPVSSETSDRGFYLSASNIVFEPDEIYGLVSLIPLGILLASSGLNATPPSE